MAQPSQDTFPITFYHVAQFSLPESIHHVVVFVSVFMACFLSLECKVLEEEALSVFGLCPRSQPREALIKMFTDRLSNGHYF